MKKLFYIVVYILFFSIQLHAQQNSYKVACIGFYNLENLFDTEDDSVKYDSDFTPEGIYSWTMKKYQKKLENLSKVIGEMGKKVSHQGPIILGVAEVENRKVLEDLVKMPKIKDKNYQIIHYESPDLRGIDVALLYNPLYFTAKYHRRYYLKLKKENGRNKYTRDQLYVAGYLDGEYVHIIVNHWPSRSGGEKRTRYFRNAAADLTMYIVQNIRKRNKDSKIIIMGDFNDDPLSQSMKEHIISEGNLKKLEPEEFYNPWEKLYKKGYGTLAWNDTWNLFDQIILSSALIDKKKNYNDYRFYKTEIFNPSYLQNKTGRYKGYPFRFISSGIYTGGYSDHFPVMIYLLKKVN